MDVFAHSRAVVSHAGSIISLQYHSFLVCSNSRLCRLASYIPFPIHWSSTVCHHGNLYWFCQCENRLKCTQMHFVW